MRERSLDGLMRRLRIVPTTTSESRWLNSARRVWLWLFVTPLLFIGLVGFYQVRSSMAAWPDVQIADQLALVRSLRPGTYLILFQNARELRPTGGFLGSFAEVSVGWLGEIKSITLESNIYLRDQGFPESDLAAPQPIREFTGNNYLTLRDSNWALDFPTAAVAIADLYQQKGGKPVDGVIAVTNHLLEQILEETGPLSLPDGTMVISAATVTDVLQDYVEGEYWADPANWTNNQPKKILADLVPVLISKFKQLDAAARLRILIRALSEKDLMISVNDSILSSSLRRLNWDGHVLPTEGDYLYLNEANLTGSGLDSAGNMIGAKSSWSIDRRLTLVREPSAGGGVRHTLVFDRTHNGAMVWPDGPNDSYLRFALPLDSQLIAATRNGGDYLSEVRLSEESGRSVVGLWAHVQPDETEQIKLIYDTPTSWPSNLTLQRQPGMPTYPVEVWNGPSLHWQGDFITDQIIAD